MLASYIRVDWNFAEKKPLESLPSVLTAAAVRFNSPDPAKLVHDGSWDLYDFSRLEPRRLGRQTFAHHTAHQGCLTSEDVLLLLDDGSFFVEFRLVPNTLDLMDVLKC